MYAECTCKGPDGGSITGLLRPWCLAILLVLGTLSKAGAGQCNPVGTWYGTLTSAVDGSTGTISNWIMRGDGTTSGQWSVTGSDGTVTSSSNATGAYIYSAGQYMASYTGTAIESEYGTTSLYSLTIQWTLSIDCDQASGTYMITFSNPQWASDNGTCQVNRVNHDPQLSNGLVDPASGDTATDFYWYVDYYDQDLDPASSMELYIDGDAYAMSLYSGSSWNGTYRYGPKKLSEGSHDFYFYFTDGDGGDGRYPVMGTMSGPSVGPVTFSIAGTVTDRATLLPLDNARVGCWNDESGIWTETRTNADGRYVLTNIQPGNVEVRAEPDSPYAWIGTEFELTQDINDLDFACGPEAILSGRVLDAETAEPVTGVEVAYCNDRYAVWQDDYTNTDGTFSLANLPPGIAEIKARPQADTGYAWSLSWNTTLVYLPEGSRKSRCAIPLQKGALATGCVRDSSLDPLGNFEIEYMGRNCEGWLETDPDGYYRIRLPLGEYTVSLDEGGVGALPAEISIVDINQPVEVNDIIVYIEDTGGQISGNINNPGGYSRTGEFLVVAFEAGTVIDANTLATIVPVSEPQSSEAGPFVISALPPDANYDIYLVVESETTDEMESIAVRDYVFDVAVGASGINLNYDSEGGTVGGSVINVDGAGVLGAEVVLTESATGGFAGFGDVDSNGVYTVHNVPAGTYIATATHSKYLNVSRTIQVSDGMTTNVPDIIMPFSGEKEVANLNGDGIVNMLDFAEFANQWLESGLLEADFTQDGKVDTDDLLRLTESWLWRPIWYNW